MPACSAGTWTSALYRVSFRFSLAPCFVPIVIRIGSSAGHCKSICDIGARFSGAPILLVDGLSTAPLCKDFCRLQKLNQAVLVLHGIYTEVQVRGRWEPHPIQPQGSERLGVMLM
jgi:hypothetical protein